MGKRKRRQANEDSNHEGESPLPGFRNAGPRPAAPSPAIDRGPRWHPPERMQTHASESRPPLSLTATQRYRKTATPVGNQAQLIEG